MTNPYLELTDQFNRGRRAWPRTPALRPHTFRSAMTEARDRFLSEEDLDLQHLSDEELCAYYSLWLRQAQATNDEDAPFYSHGVFERDPAVNDNERE
jgi:hypothetical protein